MTESRGVLEIAYVSPSYFLGGALTIEVRNAHHQLVQTVKRAAKLELPEGLYSVSAVLEDGARHTHLAEVQRETPVRVTGEWEMAQLSAAASSASQVAHWLAASYHNPDAPLQTLRVLLSPQPNEAIAPPVAARAVQRATRDHVELALRDFKRDCDSRTDNVAFVYMAGHGIQLTKHEAIVLLEDMGSDDHLNPLDGAIDATGCCEGMRHDGTAATQFWFVDACRQVPEIAQQFEAMSAGVLSLTRRRGERTSSTLFLASSTRGAAFARTDKSTLFCEALLDALSGKVAESIGTPARWAITSSRLIDRLPELVRELARAEGAEQNVETRANG